MSNKVMTTTSDKDPTKKSTIIKYTYINVPNLMVIPKNYTYKTKVLINPSKPLPTVQEVSNISQQSHLSSSTVKTKANKKHVSFKVEEQKTTLNSTILIKHPNLLSRSLKNVRYGLRGSSLIGNSQNTKRLKKGRYFLTPTKESVDTNLKHEISLTKKVNLNDLSNLQSSISDKPKKLSIHATSSLVNVFDETRHSSKSKASPISTCSTSPPLELINTISVDNSVLLNLPTTSFQISSIPKTRAASANLITNPIKIGSSAVLAIIFKNEIIIIVQELEISFWKFPSQLYNILATRQQWELIGQTDRQNTDLEIKTPYQNRLYCYEENTAYIELRARQNDPTELRKSYITLVYLNVYYFDQNEQKLMLKHVDLDKICGNARSICYTIIPNTCYFIMTWTKEAVNQTRCGVCKYSLSPDLDTLANILELPYLQHSIKSLSYCKDNKLLGFGQSIVTMWDHTTCELLLNIDIVFPIGKNLGCFLLNENDQKYLFLTQLIDSNCLKLIAINLSDSFTFKVIQSHEIPSSLTSVVSTSMQDHCLTVTYENGGSLLFSLDNPKIIYLRTAAAATVAKSKDELFKLFVQDDKIFHLTREHLIIKTINDYFLETNA